MKILSLTSLLFFLAIASCKESFTAELTQEIDSISRKIKNDGFQLYVNTHDSSNKARFYSWGFRETWEIASPVLSNLYKNEQVVERDISINISRCWQESASSEILLSSTERLSEDKISVVTIAFVPGNSIKLNELYSVLVRQYSHTREGYEYLEKKKKNTEKIGTIFDPQPSELKGNFICIINPEEQVIGWVGVRTVTEKRIFIYRRDRLPNWSYLEEDCTPRDVPLDSVPNYISRGYLINTWNYSPPSPEGFYMAKARCIDCRLMGTNVKPSYWPN